MIVLLSISQKESQMREFGWSFNYKMVKNHSQIGFYGNVKSSRGAVPNFLTLWRCNVQGFISVLKSCAQNNSREKIFKYTSCRSIQDS